MKEKKEKDRILKGLKQAVKEIKLIEEGKLKPHSLDELLDEVRQSRGGARKGAGKKSPLQTKYPDEVKKRVTVRVYPTQLEKIEKKYGSLQSAIDSLK